jgi:hypothetical protein
VTPTPWLEAVWDTYTLIKMQVRKNNSGPFDVEEFLRTLIQVLEINPNTLKEWATKETVTVNAVLYDTASANSIHVANRLVLMVLTNDTQLEGNNIFIENIEIDPSNSAYVDQQSSSDSGKLSTGGIVAIAVVVPIVALMIMGIVILAYRRQGANTSDLPKERPERAPVDEEKGTSSSSSRRTSTAESSESEEEPKMPKTTRKELKKIKKENRADSSNENSDVSDSDEDKMDDEEQAESSNSE